MSTPTSPNPRPGNKVCIIGAGATGLVALKNLLEAGFEVTAYERNAYVGGLWHIPSEYSGQASQMTALAGTVANASKYSMCFSDFPFPESTSLFPTAAEIQTYLKSYATHFDLWRQINLSTVVVSIERDDVGRQWVVTTHSTTSPSSDTATHETTSTFDRLILATGPHARPNPLQFPGSCNFRGETVHSQYFKTPSKYAGKSVVVIGSGQTAADTVEFLRVAGAKKLWLSHRRGIWLLPRMFAGRPTEATLTRRLLIDGAKARAQDPATADAKAEQTLTTLRDGVWPELRDNPAFASSRDKPSLRASLPVVCDSLAANLISGAVESVQAIARFEGPDTVGLADGTKLGGVDAVIVCSGHKFDFGSLLPKQYDPTNTELAPEQYAALRSAKHYHDRMIIPRLYRRFLSLQEPQSLAFLGHAVSKTTIGLFPFYDLVSMALAQLWKGDGTEMPGRAEMEAECDGYFAALKSLLDHDVVNNTGVVPDLSFEEWLHETAGTGIPRMLEDADSKDKDVHLQLMEGFNSPHAMRLFETSRRPAWEGAREAIAKTNRDINAMAKGGASAC